MSNRNPTRRMDVVREELRARHYADSTQTA